MKIYSLSSLPLSLSFHFTISCGKVEIESTKNAFTSAKLVIVAKTFFLFLFLLLLLVEEKYGWTNKGKMDVGVKVEGGRRGWLCARSLMPFLLINPAYRLPYSPK